MSMGCNQVRIFVTWKNVLEDCKSKEDSIIEFYKLEQALESIRPLLFHSFIEEGKN